MSKKKNNSVKFCEEKHTVTADRKPLVVLAYTVSNHKALNITVVGRLIKQ